MNWKCNTDNEDEAKGDNDLNEAQRDVEEQKGDMQEDEDQGDGDANEIESGSEDEPDDDEEYLEYLLGRQKLYLDGILASLFYGGNRKPYRAQIYYKEDFLKRAMNGEELAMHGYPLPNEWVEGIKVYGITRRAYNRRVHERNVEDLIRDYNYDMHYKVKPQQEALQGNCKAINIPRRGGLADIHKFHYTLESVRTGAANGPDQSHSAHCKLCVLAQIYPIE